MLDQRAQLGRLRGLERDRMPDRARFGNALGRRLAGDEGARQSRAVLALKLMHDAYAAVAVGRGSSRTGRDRAGGFAPARRPRRLPRRRRRRSPTARAAPGARLAPAHRHPRPAHGSHAGRMRERLVHPVRVTARSRLEPECGQPSLCRESTPGRGGDREERSSASRLRAPGPSLCSALLAAGPPGRTPRRHAARARGRSRRRCR